MSKKTRKISLGKKLQNLRTSVTNFFWEDQTLCWLFAATEVKSFA